jgi:hypothetical protein
MRSTSKSKSSSRNISIGGSSVLSKENNELHGASKHNKHSKTHALDNNDHTTLGRADYGSLHAVTESSLNRLPRAKNKREREHDEVAKRLPFTSKRPLKKRSRKDFESTRDKINTNPHACTLQELVDLTRQ